MNGTGAADGLEYGPVRADKVDALDRIVSQALFFPPHLPRLWIEWLGAANFRVVRRGGWVVAGLGVVPMGHWRVGASVPTAGITAVGVAPEHRGGGVGVTIRCGGCWRRSTPWATRPPRLPLDLRLLPADRLRARRRARDGRVAVVPVEEAEHGALRAVYAATARRTAGNLDRPDFVWWRILAPCGQTARAHRAARDGRTEGYIVFTREGREDPLRILDLRTLIKAAGERLLAFLAGRRSMVDRIEWHGGGATDLLVALLPARRYKQIRSFDWLLRIVYVRGAPEARGCPPTTTASSSPRPMAGGRSARAGRATSNSTSAASRRSTPASRRRAHCASPACSTAPRATWRSPGWSSPTRGRGRRTCSSGARQTAVAGELQRGGPMSHGAGARGRPP